MSKLSKYARLVKRVLKTEGPLSPLDLIAKICQHPTPADVKQAMDELINAGEITLSRERKLVAQKNNSNEFLRHLDAISAEVETWPAWKRSSWLKTEEAAVHEKASARWKP